jgi:hypothetical protein
VVEDHSDFDLCDAGLLETVRAAVGAYHHGIARFR